MVNLRIDHTLQFDWAIHRLYCIDFHFGGYHLPMDIDPKLAASCRDKKVDELI